MVRLCGAVGALHAEQQEGASELLRCYIKVFNNSHSLFTVLCACFFSFNQPRIVFLFPLLWLCFCVEGNSAAAPGVMERCLQELLLLLSVKTPPVCA